VGKWGVSKNNRKAKYYSLTATGRKQLLAEEESWNAVATAVARVLEGA
jgi:DNA-binding PadR family transcriptional regulator